LLLKDCSKKEAHTFKVLVAKRLFKERSSHFQKCLLLKDCSKKQAHTFKVLVAKRLFKEIIKKGSDSLFEQEGQ
jgi:hypothetical protein